MVSRFTFAMLTASDLEDVARLNVAGYEGYRAFAPAGWEPPSVQDEVEGLERWLADPACALWALVARAGDGSLAGHVAFIPASRHGRLPLAGDDVAHIGYLFVAPAHWGSGLAGELLARAAQAAAARGHGSLRLFVVEGQARARRFYEREGFRCVGPLGDLGLGLASLDYRRSV